jgi:hypothetical protein
MNYTDNTTEMSNVELAEWLEVGDLVDRIQREAARRLRLAIVPKFAIGQEVWRPYGPPMRITEGPYWFTDTKVFWSEDHLYVTEEEAKAAR